MTTGTVLRALVGFETLLFVVPALLHAGVPLGGGEPAIVPAAIAEGLIGTAFAVVTWALIRGVSWRHPAAVGAHVFALLGTLIGLGATFSGGGERTALNTSLHGAMLVAALAGLALLRTESAGAALGRWAR